MSAEGSNARATLDAWREHGADRMDPVRFHRIDALERRAVGHDGVVRRELESRLTELLAAYAGDLERAATRTEADSDDSVADATEGATLAELLGRITRQAAARDGSMAGNDRPDHATFPELGALRDARKLWTRIRTESQLRQSLEQAPTDAGPLNSARLVHRSITLMHELSPGYLQQFLSYVDALTWMEQMGAGGVAAAEVESRVAAGVKRARETPRRRRAQT